MPAETVPASERGGCNGSSDLLHARSLLWNSSLLPTHRANSSPLSQAILHTLLSSTRPPSAPGDTWPSLGTHDCGMDHLCTLTCLLQAG